MTLKIANEIEEALNKEGLVGKRMGSGFCFLDNSRDVQFEYSSNEVKEYLSKIEKIISEFTTKYEDYEITVRFKNNSFSFYVKPPIEKKDSAKCVIEDKAVDDAVDEAVDEAVYEDC